MLETMEWLIEFMDVVTLIMEIIVPLESTLMVAKIVISFNRNYNKLN